MDRGNHTREQLDLRLRPLLAGEHEQHQVFPDGRGYMRKNLKEIKMWPVLADEHGEYNVFPVQPANPQPPRAALALALLLDLGAVVGLPQQIEREREAFIRLIVPATPAAIDTGLVPTVDLVDNGGGSSLTLTPTLEVFVAEQTK